MLPEVFWRLEARPRADSADGGPIAMTPAARAEAAARLPARLSLMQAVVLLVLGDVDLALRMGQTEQTVAKRSKASPASPTYGASLADREAADPTEWGGPNMFWIAVRSGDRDAVSVALNRISDAAAAGRVRVYRNRKPLSVDEWYGRRLAVDAVAHGTHGSIVTMVPDPPGSPHLVIAGEFAFDRDDVLAMYALGKRPHVTTSTPANATNIDTGGASLACEAMPRGKAAALKWMEREFEKSGLRLEQKATKWHLTSVSSSSKLCTVSEFGEAWAEFPDYMKKGGGRGGRPPRTQPPPLPLPNEQD